MLGRAFWKAHEIRDHIAVASNKLAPTLWLKNAMFLHPYLNKWVGGNIWIYQDRIIYVGDKEPEITEGTEIYDCSGQYLVPGYIEPHAHPFQLYNPHSLAKYVSQTGTTTLVCDNLLLLLQFNKKKAFSFIDDLQLHPVQFFWWARYDLQTEMREENEMIAPDIMKQWIEHPLVIQGGELTGWPRLLGGDDLYLQWINETKKMGKRIEGHFPGASEATLTKMKLCGIDSDHEAITGEEVYRRLKSGYTVSLRHSSIRPDLETLLTDILQLGIKRFDEMFFTTDGSTPLFYQDGMINKMIEIAINQGVPAFEAYKMATYNVAKYFQLDSYIGVIAPGRIASINILESKENPHPVSVLAKGKWIKKENELSHPFPEVNWNKYGIKPLNLEWELTMDDLQFSMPMGLKMRNAVIMEPYSITLDNSIDELSLDHDESFLVLIDKNGKWRINTMLKGFAKAVKGFASSYSTTGDILLIGKDKHDILKAFQRLKEIGGGIVLTENGEVLHEIPLHINGVASAKSFLEIMEEEKTLDRLMRERGYPFLDVIYTLLFLSSTHLPYIRITPDGIYDVMKKTVLFPSIMR
ncbi:adenine deaminase C-terminal domain-containing protein [Bacillus alveayuensis]|jgi:adenine deaminase|uniref:adenine deaminase C-terminal domain-containing protein n=1 Tax=Aeribacillus alveayuensis TaxID=279215 RepID=UPI0005D0EF2C|nr:adenine deaminase C-terminal domain-containing protein [Bacillus alveayuensis]